MARTSDVHDHGVTRASPVIRRRLALFLAPFVVGTFIGVVVLWPSGEGPRLEGQPAEPYEATIVRVVEAPCGEIPNEGSFDCAEVAALLDSGPDEGEVITFSVAQGASGRHYEEGDGILVTKSPDAPEELQYNFYDYQRSNPMLLLAVMFGVVVVLLSRWRGLMALLGLAISLGVLLQFVLPAILEGKSPLAVAIVGSSVIMFVAVYLAHGFNARTTTAVIGTLVSLSLTGLLALVFVEASRFTGFGSEEAVFLQVSAQQINLQGLLLGGIIIGTLGVLDDVTVTQASAVWQLRIANPGYSAAELYRSAVRIGHDHIASTVNTLVLAYAGAALPMLVLFTLSSRPMGQLITSEVVAEEVVRTLVGSIGLVASVPITTLLASVVVSGEAGRQLSGRGVRKRIAERRAGRSAGFRRPRAEQEWREVGDEARVVAGEDRYSGAQDEHTP